MELCCVQSPCFAIWWIHDRSCIPTRNICPGNSSEGQILFTQKGKLLRCSSEVVSFLEGNALFICDHQGSTLSSHRYTDDEPDKAGSSKSILFCFLFGCLIKIGVVYRLYQFLGRLSNGGIHLI